jgi:L-alanine-DL-glutamate epimerase-like enolase superfamily enzyme
MLESRIGLSAALHIASATQAFEHFDLDSDQLIARQPVSGGFERHGDELTVGDGPGLGCMLTAGWLEMAKSSLTALVLSRRSVRGETQINADVRR